MPRGEIGTYCYVNAVLTHNAIKDAKEDILRGGHLEQRRKSAIARGERPTKNDRAHLDICSNCSKYIDTMRQLLELGAV